MGDAKAYAQAAKLFRAYQRELGDDLCFQGFEEELKTLPGKYAEPDGALWLALADDGSAHGVVAVRPFAPGQCEMKRLYVAPTARGLGLGRRLAETTLKFARSNGYHEMLLDTLTRLTPALNMYRDLGFETTEAYYGNPIDDVVYMRLKL